MKKAFEKKKTLISVLLAFACIVSAGCGKAVKWEYDPITDVNDLEGRRVGVNLSWESDYYLTGRKDMKLFRYDTTSDLIMALKYDKIDAIALDIDTIKLMMSRSEGLEMVEPAFAQVGSIMYFGADDKALVEDFNKYLAEFKKTDEYKDLLKRLDDFNGSDYIPPDPDITLTGSGEVINVIMDPNSFPRAFLNPGEKIPTGYDTEIIKRFANDRGYKLEFYMSDYDDGVMGLQSGNYDIMTGYIGDVYADGVEEAGLYICDRLFEYPLYYIQKNQADIKSETSELD